jgi:hypothetical protein
MLMICGTPAAAPVCKAVVDVLMFSGSVPQTAAERLRSIILMRDLDVTLFLLKVLGERVSDGGAPASISSAPPRHHGSGSLTGTGA